MTGYPDPSRSPSDPDRYELNLGRQTRLTRTHDPAEEITYELHGLNAGSETVYAFTDTLESSTVEDDTTIRSLVSAKDVLLCHFSTRLRGTLSR